jgi:hypothetical protein
MVVFLRTVDKLWYWYPQYRYVGYNQRVAHNIIRNQIQSKVPFGDAEMRRRNMKRKEEEGRKLEGSRGFRKVTYLASKYRVVFFRKPHCRLGRRK